MLAKEIVRRILKIQRNPISLRLSSSQINIDKLENEQEVSEVIQDNLAQQKEKELEAKRNKSRLRPADYRMLHEQNPYPEPSFWHHGTLKYIRRTYGRYGSASGVDPSICWPVKEEIEEAVEYERVKYPYTIPEMIQDAKNKREEKERLRMQRQEDIVKKMQKLDQWKEELNSKIEKRESEALEAKMRKDRLIEEVRRHFGYTVDPRDDRFKELLEKKEKEQKKAMKEARKKAKEELALKRLLTKKSEEQVESSENSKNE